MAQETTLTIVGNLTADPDHRVTEAGRHVVSFSVANTPRRFDRATGTYVDEETNFLRVSAWGSLAENIAKSLRKGNRVIVSGRLGTSVWVDKTSGEPRRAFELTADSVGAELTFATASIARVIREDGSAADRPTGQPAASPALAGVSSEAPF